MEVPSFFLCPISLQIMRDPVTLPTGITYDRDNIERWLFSKDSSSTCPITKQPISVTDQSVITPNHTLRRLIQAWCVTHASADDGIERFPTPKPPVEASQITKLIEEAQSNLLSSLRKLKSIVSENERNRRCVESTPAATDFLVSTLKKHTDNASIVEEALVILNSLRVTATSSTLIDTLTKILAKSNYQCRAYAVLVLKSVLPMLTSAEQMVLHDQLFSEMTNILRDRISYQATKSALQVLCMTTSWGRNKIKAVDSGAVSILIDLLMDETEKKAIEMMLIVLSRLSECAEGRAEIAGHAAGIAVVAKKLVRVSIVATERAVRIVHSIAKYSATGKVLREMMEYGVVSKMCLLVQVDCGGKTKEKVKEVLRIHSRVWRNSPCISPQLIVSYPV